MLRVRLFSTCLPKLRSVVPKANKMPPRPKVNESEIEEKFIKGGSGHGGQKINKCNSKVQLRHIPTGIVVTSQATRSRDQNRKSAREILALKLDELEKGAQSRAQLVIARKQMLKRRAKRKTKAKYRKLEEQKEGEDDQGRKEDGGGVDIGENDVVIIKDDVVIIKEE